MAIWGRLLDLFGTRNQPKPIEPWQLIPLTPSYIPTEHENYVATIKTALSDPHIRNIALSGSYGVGKSSILQELAQQLGKKAVELSLSTLAPIETTKLAESVPLQATTPTNRIQQEIVKQLLYREDPSKAPGSRFKRIEPFRTCREIAIAILLGFIVTTIFLLTGWTTTIFSIVFKKFSAWSHLCVWSSATIFIFCIRKLFYGQFHIKQLSAGSATVSLDEKSVSYFDQYLDEIVYFFVTTKCDVVIFEDIDRFNDSHIFDTLRALNTLLNTTPQIKKPIRFIYAIKDSIFDRTELESEGRKLEPTILTIEDSALADTIRANRTKFFDLVIPVVPFITHRSARNLATQLLEQIEHKIAPELLDLTAQYVPDMRLLKNIRNEFIVFRERILSGDGKHLNLTETELFAMMLYKSTHMADFEAIRLGKSKLDILYEQSRQMVIENIQRLTRTRNEQKQALEEIKTNNTHAQRLGTRLKEYFQRLFEASRSYSSYSHFELKLNNKKIDLQNLTEISFWSNFSQDQSHLTIGWSGNNQHIAFNFSFESIAAILDDPLTVKRWNQLDCDSLTEQINEITRKIQFLQIADLNDLIAHPEFILQHNGKSSTLEELAHLLLKQGLAYELVRTGHITRNFTLYTSTFHGNRVSSAATNFIIHHIDRNLMDEYFALTTKDVKAIIRERGQSVLKEPALYNINVLDYLLEKDHDDIKIMLTSIAEMGNLQKRFLQAYLSTGTQSKRLIEKLHVFSPDLLIYLISETELDDSLRLDLVAHMLAKLSLSPLSQKTNTVVSQYLKDHYTDFLALTSDDTDATLAKKIATLFSNSGITISHLEQLGRQISTVFIAKNLYEITPKNLMIASDNPTGCALDSILKTNQTVYDYVLQNLSIYLNACDEKLTTINSSEKFTTIIEDVLIHDASQLERVISLAANDCLVSDLSMVSDTAWLALVKHQRVPTTFNNVRQYIGVKEEVDENLAKLLVKTQTIEEVNGIDEDSKIKVATAILAATKHGLSPNLRTKLVEEIDLENYLDVDSITPEAGDLFPLLLRSNIIADEVESYQHLATTSWKTRQEFIKESTKFPTYMTPELLHSDLAEILSSNEIGSSIKSLVLSNAAKYAEGADLSTLNAMALFAIEHGHTLPLDLVLQMANTKVPAHLVLSLLQHLLPSISSDELTPVLQALGGDYAKLTEQNPNNIKIPDTPENRVLLEWLENDSSTKHDSDDEYTPSNE